MTLSPYAHRQQNALPFTPESATFVHTPLRGAPTSPPWGVGKALVGALPVSDEPTKSAVEPNYYAPTIASDAMTVCTSQRGTFAAN